MFVGELLLSGACQSGFCVVTFFPRSGVDVQVTVILLLTILEDIDFQAVVYTSDGLLSS